VEKKVTPKLSRNDLKSIIKECLVEILQEGLNESVSQQSRQSLRESAPAQAERQRPAQRQSIQDKISFLPKHSTAKEEVHESVNRSNIKTITDDPIMREILSDTASTTLLEQSRAESSKFVPGSDRASQVVANSDPMDLFSGSSDKWAALAFSGPVRQ
jgi:hypothetical protein